MTLRAAFRDPGPHVRWDSGIADPPGRTGFPARPALIPDPDRDPLAPRTLGHWRLVTELGRGNWATVFLARPGDARAGAAGCYAIKLLDDGDGNAEGGDTERGANRRELALATLRREALVGLSVSHPHLVSVLAAHVHEPPYYLVAPFLPGESLRERLNSGGEGRSSRIAVAEALWIARQVASALAALHEAGWRHGDVKPDNIVIAPSGHATLVDLGFCQPARTAPRVGRMVAGTSDYLAPEAHAPAMPIGPAADLYGLGVTLYEMLAGRRPFAGEDAEELAAHHRQSPPPDIRHFRPDVPLAVSQLVRQLLYKEPLRRAASATDVAQHLLKLEVNHFALR